MNGVMNRRRYTAMPEQTYHARPELSSTGARRILDSPARFNYWRTHPEAPKREFDLGSAVHSKVLGVGYGIEVLDFKDFRTNAAKEAEADARARGLIPVLQRVYDEVGPIAESVLAHPTARLFFEQDGNPEVSVFSTDRETGVQMRARFDFLPKRQKGRRVAVDLKTSGLAVSPSAFARSVARHGYDVQDGHYKHTEGDPDLEMVFIAVEVEPPYLVSLNALDREFAEIGAKRAARARRLFAECTASGMWPGYAMEVVALHPPVFHVNEFMEMTNE